MLITLLAFTSCKKRQLENLNATTLEAIQALVLGGFWQLDQYQEEEGAEIQELESFAGAEFINSNQVKYHFSKSGEINYTSYYRFTYFNGRVSLISYETLEQYNNNEYEESIVTYVEVKDGKFVIVDRNGHVQIFKKYKSISDAKNLPNSM